MCLDQYLGRTKVPVVSINPPSQPVSQGQRILHCGSQQYVSQKQATPRGQLDPVIQHASYLTKPQLSFKRRVENNDLPWRPTLLHKYNAQAPLGYEYHDSNVDISGNDSRLM
jgi:exosome complex exonuclease RRP6